MGKMKELFYEFQEQVQAADDADDSVTIQVAQAVASLRNALARLTVARRIFTFNNTAIREALDHEIKAIENDINFLETLVKILTEQEAA